MCRLHHTEQHRIGIRTFEAKHGFRMVDIAHSVAVALAALA